MKAKDIEVGGTYQAKVNDQVVVVRVDKIGERREAGSYGRPYQTRTIYYVTNLKTGRKTTFRSSAKFRSLVTSAQAKAYAKYGDAARFVAEGEQCLYPTPPGGVGSAAGSASATASPPPSPFAATAAGLPPGGCDPSE